MSRSDSKPKMTVYSSASNIGTDLEMRTIEAKTIFCRISLFIFFDLVLSILVTTHECNIYNDKNIVIIRLIIESSCIFVILLTFFILLSLYRYLLTKILRYFYIVLSLLYFMYKLIFHIYIFMEDFNNISPVDLLFFFITLGTITPRVVIFYYIDLFIEKLMVMEETKKCEEHDKFVEKIGNKMDRGDSNWSNTGLPSERQTNTQFLLTTENNKIKNNQQMYTIEENHFIEEEDKEDKEE